MISPLLEFWYSVCLFSLSSFSFSFFFLLQILFMFKYIFGVNMSEAAESDRQAGRQAYFRSASAPRFRTHEILFIIIIFLSDLIICVYDCVQ